MFGSLGDGGSKFVIMEDAKDEDIEHGGRLGVCTRGGDEYGLGAEVGVCDWA